jgi:hypothetical protein
METAYLKYKVDKNTSGGRDWVQIYYTDLQSLKDNALQAFIDKVITAEELEKVGALDSVYAGPDSMGTIRITYYITAEYNKEIV